jgi:hypothetical protein
MGCLDAPEAANCKSGQCESDVVCRQKRAGWTCKKIVQAWRGRDDARAARRTQRERARVSGAGKEMYGALEGFQAQSMLAAIVSWA